MDQNLRSCVWISDRAFNSCSYVIPYCRDEFYESTITVYRAIDLQNVTTWLLYFIEVRVNRYFIFWLRIDSILLLFKQIIVSVKCLKKKSQFSKYVVTLILNCQATYAFNLIRLIMVKNYRSFVCFTYSQNIIAKYNISFTLRGEYTLRSIKSDNWQNEYNLL